MSIPSVDVFYVHERPLWGYGYHRTTTSRIHSSKRLPEAKGIMQWSAVLSWLTVVWEPFYMLRSVLYWTMAGSLVGMLVGVVVTYFLKFLFWSIATAAPWPFWWFSVLLPAGGLVSGLLIHYLAPDAAGHGTEAVIRAVHEKAGAINWRVAPVKALATLATIAVGGSAGKEGPSAQIGAAVASALADLLRFSPDQRRRIVICGIGAGFATVFGTPVAGGILGIEVLAMGAMLYEMLLPSFAASLAAFEMARLLGLTWFYPRVALALPFSLGSSGRILLLGVVAGLVSYLLVLGMEGFHRAADRLRQRGRVWPPLMPALAGTLLFLLMLAVGRSYGGLSLPLLTTALSGHAAAGLAWFGKLLFVAITLGLGMSGGIITPLFVIGATLGAAMAGPLHLPVSSSAAIGMVAVTASGANVPIAAVLLGMEFFGSALGPNFLVAALPAFILIGHHSVYPSQQVRMQKSSWVQIEQGLPLEKAKRSPVPPPWRRNFEHDKA